MSHLRHNRRSDPGRLLHGKPQFAPMMPKCYNAAYSLPYPRNKSRGQPLHLRLINSIRRSCGLREKLILLTPDASQCIRRHSESRLR
jgi:hypothetical protein